MNPYQPGEHTFDFGLGLDIDVEMVVVDDTTGTLIVALAAIKK